jgi:hypothetical protein
MKTRVQAPASELKTLLKQCFGFDGFRPLQEEIVRDALAGRNVVALLPAAGGKSLCFQLAALALPGFFEKLWLINKNRLKGRPSGGANICLNELRLIEGVAGGAEDVFDFVADEFFDFGPGGGEVLAGVEFLRILEEDFADGGGHGEAKVGVDVDLGATGAAGDFDIGFGNAGGVFAEFATVFVDVGDEVFGNRGGSVEDERVITEAGIHERFLDGFEAIEIEMLFALELVGTMGIADGDGERIDAGFLDEFNGFFGMGVMAAGGVTTAFFAFVKLRADQFAEFAFNHAVMFVGVIDDFFAEFGVLFERVMAAINHHAGEPFVDAFLAKFEGVAVVEVDGDGNGGEADGGFDEALEVNGIGVLAGALGDLEHDRGFFLFAGFNDGLEQFHVVDVESAERVFAFEGLGEQLFGVCQWHNSPNSISNSRERKGRIVEFHGGI